MDYKKVSDGLGLTPQQFDILQCIYGIQVDGHKASPKAIQADYRKHSGKYLMKPNLFNLLRLLKGKGYIVQANFGEYNVDIKSISESLKAREVSLSSELDDFKILSANVEDYFTKAASQYERPYVTYLELDYFSKNISKALQTATTYYSTTSYPNLTFNPDVASAIKRPEYVRVLWERAIVKKELVVKYLTDLNMEYLFNYVSKAHQNEETAGKICLDVLNQLQAHVESHDNLEIFYQDTPLYLDIHMPENLTPKEFYSHLRGLRSEIRGVVYVKSRDAAQATKKLFLEMLERGQRIEGPRGKRIISSKRKELKQRLEER